MKLLRSSAGTFFAMTMTCGATAPMATPAKSSGFQFSSLISAGLAEW
jgi:hypothetical protein